MKGLFQQFAQSGDNALDWLFALLVVALVCGCTGIRSGLPVGYDVEAESNEGVVVGSVGSLRPLRGNKSQEWTSYSFRSTTDHEIHGSVRSTRFVHLPLNPLPDCAVDALPDECGILFAIPLPAGEYEFFAAAPAMDSASSSPGILENPWDTPLLGYNFTVGPGRVTYLGNLLSRICTGTGSYFSLARSAVGDVADMYDRDVPLLREKFPQINGVPINNETMAGMPWRWEFQQPDDILPVEWPNACAPERHRVSAPTEN